MKKLFILLLFCTFLRADTHTAATCNVDKVGEAITAASSGDTVYVPAGECTWNSQIVINKGITLMGPGSDKLTITGNYTAPYPTTYNNDSVNFLIAYAPTNPSARETFRITGFNINTGGKCLGLQLFNSSAVTKATIPNRIRVDHNTFNTGGKIAIHVKLMWGVIDNNTFTNCSKIAFEDLDNADPWNSDLCPGNYGSGNYMYAEDNTFNIPSNTLAAGVGYSGRAVVRYNEFNYSSDSNYAIFDIHNLDPLYYGGMIAEVYGNRVNQSVYPNRTVKFIDHRGGKLLVFYNQVNGNTGISQIGVRQEDPENSQPASTCSQSYLPSDSYYFNNRHGSANMELGESPENDWSFSDGGYGEIAENVNFFRYNSGCTKDACAAGIGIGSAVPTGTCTAGVGYWKTSQSDSNTTGMVGINPTATVSGTLYKCTASDTWTVYYTPYAYPHPLRSESTGNSSRARLRKAN